MTLAGLMEAILVAVAWVQQSCLDHVDPDEGDSPDASLRSYVGCVLSCPVLLDKGESSSLCQDSHVTQFIYCIRRPDTAILLQYNNVTISRNTAGRLADTSMASEREKSLGCWRW